MVTFFCSLLRFCRHIYCRSVFKYKKSLRNTVTKQFNSMFTLIVFACWWKDPDPGPNSYRNLVRIQEALRNFIFELLDVLFSLIGRFSAFDRFSFANFLLKVKKNFLRKTVLLKEDVLCPYWLPVGGVGWLGGAEPRLLGRHLPRVPRVQGVLPQEELHAAGGSGAVGQAPAPVRISHRWAKLIVTSFLSTSSTNPSLEFSRRLISHPRCPMKKKFLPNSGG